MLCEFKQNRDQLQNKLMFFYLSCPALPKMLNLSDVFSQQTEYFSRK